MLWKDGLQRMHVVEPKDPVRDVGPLACPRTLWRCPPPRSRLFATKIESRDDELVRMMNRGQNGTTTGAPPPTSSTPMGRSSSNECREDQHEDIASACRGDHDATSPETTTMFETFSLLEILKTVSMLVVQTASARVASLHREYAFFDRLAFTDLDADEHEGDHLHAGGSCSCADDEEEDQEHHSARPPHYTACASRSRETETRGTGDVARQKPPSRCTKRTTAQGEEQKFSGQEAAAAVVNEGEDDHEDDHDVPTTPMSPAELNFFGSRSSSFNQAAQGSSAAASPVQQHNACCSEQQGPPAPAHTEGTRATAGPDFLSYGPVRGTTTTGATAEEMNYKQGNNIKKVFDFSKNYDHSMSQLESKIPLELGASSKTTTVPGIQPGFGAGGMKNNNNDKRDREDHDISAQHQDITVVLSCAGHDQEDVAMVVRNKNENNSIADSGPGGAGQIKGMQLPLDLHQGEGAAAATTMYSDTAFLSASSYYSPLNFNASTSPHFATLLNLNQQNANSTRREAVEHVDGAPLLMRRPEHAAELVLPRPPSTSVPVGRSTREIDRDERKIPIETGDEVMKILSVEKKGCTSTSTCSGGPAGAVLSGTSSKASSCPATGTTAELQSSERTSAARTGTSSSHQHEQKQPTTSKQKKKCNQKKFLTLEKLLSDVLAPHCADRNSINYRAAPWEEVATPFEKLGSEDFLLKKQPLPEDGPLSPEQIKALHEAGQTNAKVPPHLRKIVIPVIPPKEPGLELQQEGAQQDEENYDMDVEPHDLFSASERGGSQAADEEPRVVRGDEPVSDRKEPQQGEVSREQNQVTPPSPPQDDSYGLLSLLATLLVCPAADHVQEDHDESLFTSSPSSGRTTEADRAAPLKNKKKNKKNISPRFQLVQIEQERTRTELQNRIEDDGFPEDYPRSPGQVHLQAENYRREVILPSEVNCQKIVAKPCRCPWEEKQFNALCRELEEELLIKKLQELCREQSNKGYAKNVNEHSFCSQHHQENHYHRSTTTINLRIPTVDHTTRRTQQATVPPSGRSRRQENPALIPTYSFDAPPSQQVQYCRDKGRCVRTRLDRARGDFVQEMFAVHPKFLGKGISLEYTTYIFEENKDSFESIFPGATPLERESRSRTFQATTRKPNRPRLQIEVTLRTEHGSQAQSVPIVRKDNPKKTVLNRHSSGVRVRIKAIGAEIAFVDLHL
ncbi:unnamed protein product [Amoebophrya sp. A120]|nr:unnamed protein product [Amoebophrya sp. A120]|eukprot:GSA120T00019964001.1